LRRTKIDRGGNYICPLDISFWKTGSAHGLSREMQMTIRKERLDLKTSQGIIIRGGGTIVLTNVEFKAPGAEKKRPIRRAGSRDHPRIYYDEGGVNKMSRK
jgi:hypothetical protein